MNSATFTGSHGRRGALGTWLPILREAARRLAPRVGDAWVCRGTGIYWKDGRTPASLQPHEIVEHFNALSAPPAASADEWKLAEALLDNLGQLESGDYNPIYCGQAMREAAEYLLAGYRKRAAPHEAPGDYEAQRVLSALPKGQEHEG